MFGKKDLNQWLIVGLGNPGPEYTKTRHNCGFRALDILAKKLGCRVDKGKFQGLYNQVSYGDTKVFLLKPQTYMNLSGNSVKQLASFYHIPPQHIIVMYDDISLEPGRLRIRADGSAGGHNGIKDLILKLSGDDFCRLKIGVSENGEKDLIDYVLGAFSKNELADLKKIAKKSVEIIDCYLKDGVEECMNKYNSFMLGNE